MSGGVDSSLAAALLREAGYEMSGIHLELYSGDKLKRERTISDLERTCYLLNIPLHTLNLEREFQDLIIDRFCREYSTGRTPNPCVACNKYIKFGLLLDKALEMGADYLATGHYARVKGSPDGYRLLKAADSTKDQSYFLYALGQKELRHLLLPVGNLHKAESRRLAARLGLPAAARRESQDICFVPDNDYRSFITEHMPLEPGDIIDTNGIVLGRHRGLALYTVGQRQGLGLASDKRLYVIKLDAPTNRLEVGTEEQLLSHKLFAGNLSWVSGKASEEASGITAKIRYKSPEAAVEVRLTDSMVEVRFHRPQRAVTPGQSIVFYRGDMVLGGGIIEDTELAL